MATTKRKDEEFVVIAISRSVRDELKRKGKGRSYDNTLREAFGLKTVVRRKGRPKGS